MKKAFLSILSLLMVVAVANAQKKPASPRVIAESNNVVVSYGQPSKKGRVIFGELVPYNKVWRAGANEATEVTFKKDVNFGGTPIKAGTYTLFTVPGETEWTVMLNPNLKQWGAYKYDSIKKDDVAAIKVKPVQINPPVEAMTFNVSDSAITLKWDTTSISVPLSF